MTVKLLSKKTLNVERKTGENGEKIKLYFLFIDVLT